ncbi:phage tail fiber protein [Caulobacter sp.]|uniref:phage tail fiber domain-containing protein n=1 Tax=Caulobacter sp. TaxID=78 RepID=UPI0031E2CA38
MYLTHVAYTAASGQTDFDVTFPYIDAAHVVVTVNNVLAPHQWLTESRIRLAYPTGAGSAVVLRRQTPLDHALVDFQNGAVLTEEDLNKAVRQVLYAQQEILDLYKAALGPAQVRLGDNLGIVTDPDKVMDELAQMVLADKLLADLNQRIADIDLNAQTVIETALRGHELKEAMEAVTYLDGVPVGTYVLTKTNELKTATSALAETFTILGAKTADGKAFNLNGQRVKVDGFAVAETFSDLYAQAGQSATAITETKQALATLDSSMATTTEQLAAQIAGNSAAIQSTATAAATATEAVARKFDLLATTTPDGKGAVLNDNVVKMTNGLTLAQTFSGVVATANDNASKIATQAAVIAENNAKITAEGMIATSTNAVIVQSDQKYASITALNSVDTKYGAKAGLALAVAGPTGQRYITGFVLNNNGISGDMTVAADRFAIVDPNVGNAIVPFEVSGGWVRAPKIIAGDIFADTITVNHLKVGSVDWTKMQPQTVTQTVAVFADSTIGVSSSTNVTLLGGSVTPQGDGVVLVTLYATAIFPSVRTTAFLGLYRNGVRIARTRASFDGQDNVPMTIVFGDVTPPIGVSCYYEIRKESGNVGFEERALVLTSAKR